MSVDALRIVVLVYVVRGPLGGMTWHHLQYALGLSQLGHDVHVVEDSGDEPWSCYDPQRHVTDSDPTYGLEYAEATFRRVGLGDRWAYHDAHTGRWHGAAAGRILDVCAGADLVVNVSAANPIRPWLENVPVRVLVDTDPAFRQIRHLTEAGARERAAAHNAFFTFGENIASGRALVPGDGFAWQPTRQPIVLDAWPVTPGRPDAKFTTLMQWDSYAVREFDGKRYGMKSASFEPYFDLPRSVGPRFELAVGGSTAPREALRQKGWRLRDPLAPSRDPWTYQRFIRQSKAEFGVAKHGYVVSWSGWFSERSAAYLASGRPVLVQDTGFSDWLETGSGAVPFTTPDEAIAGIEEIDSRYEHHCEAAREVAERYFDSRTVLESLVERAMAAPSDAAAREARAGASVG